MNDTSDITGDLWQGLYQNNLGAPRYPNPHAVRWLFGTFDRTKASQTHILDLGTGAGRHAMMMAREGFRVSATDYAESATQKAKLLSEKENLNISFDQASAENQPYDDATFDGIISYGVLYYLSYELFQAAIKEIHRLLKPGGSTFIMIKNDRDIRKSKAVMTAPHQYKITEEEPGMPWNNEIDMTLTLLPKNEIRQSFRDFGHLKIEEVTSTLKDGKYLEAAWLIYAEK